MIKKLLCALICAVLLLGSLTGCIQIRQYAKEAGPGPVETPAATAEPSELPTLQPPQGDVIPLEVLTSFAEYTAPDISRDGDMILYRHLVEFSDRIIAEDWRTGEKTEVMWPKVDGIPRYFWAPDGETVLFFVDNMCDENYGIYTTEIKTGESKTILPGGKNNCYYVSDNPKNDKEIYIKMLDFERELYDLYLLNYETGVKKLVLENSGNISSYIFDHDGNLTVVNTTDENAGEHAWLNTGFKSGAKFSENDWKKIFSWDYENSDSSGVTGVMQDGKSLIYMDSSGSNTQTLYSYDIAAGKSEKISNDPNYDISGYWTDLDLNKVTAVTVYGQKQEWRVLDDSFQDDYDVLRSIGEDFDIYDSSEQDEYWMVAYTSDVRETDYYIYDMASNEIKFLYNAQPHLSDYDFAEMEPFSYTADDGLKIEGYATFPLGQKSGLPTVVLVHGGPASRDVWGYNQEVQLLANRGYLVLQVNFRGSTGYGKNFLLAGDREWGGLMHQDILDAVEYSVAQGWTDPERVGVYGASYGGYEALICAAFSPDVFKCAVDAFGPSSLITLVESMPPQWGLARESMMKSVGNPATDAEFMESRSPLYYAKDIKIPLLIAQGDNDVRVTQQESDQMVKALRDADIPVTYLLFEDTGHGFSSKESRLSFYSEMEKFFAENLGGRIE